MKNIIYGLTDPLSGHFVKGRRKSTGGHTFRFIDARRQSPGE